MSSQPITCVGIVGAGAMGQGIAQLTAQAGLCACLFDVRPGAARSARDGIAAILAKAKVGAGSLKVGKATVKFGPPADPEDYADWPASFRELIAKTGATICRTEKTIAATPPVPARAIGPGRSMRRSPPPANSRREPPAIYPAVQQSRGTASTFVKRSQPRSRPGGSCRSSPASTTSPTTATTAQ